MSRLRSRTELLRTFVRKLLGLAFLVGLITPQNATKSYGRGNIESCSCQKEHDSEKRYVPQHSHLRAMTNRIVTGGITAWQTAGYSAKCPTCEAPYLLRRRSET